MSTPIATQIKNDSFAPRSTSAATPRERPVLSAALP
jgi:hypothetical protein